MNVLDLFSGIGGFSLGLERAGFRTVAFCEIDPYCQAVLRKHWPDVPVWGDVREFTVATLADAIGSELRQQSGRGNGSGGSGAPQPRKHGIFGIDVICGGFPCQDISVAGKGAGIEGSSSGLWSEFARIIGEIRPRYVVVENVAALLGRGISRVLGDLATLGYDAEWHCIPASAVGAPHRRDRVWIVAHADGERLQGWLGTVLSECLGERTTRTSGALENTTGKRRNGTGTQQSPDQNGSGSFREPSRSDWWHTEPDVGRVAHGVPSRVDRLRALGNSIVPQIAEIIGRAIMTSQNLPSQGDAWHETGQPAPW